MKYIQKMLMMGALCVAFGQAEAANVGVVDWTRALQTTKAWKEADVKFRKDHAKEFDVVKEHEKAIDALLEKQKKAAKTEAESLEKQLKSKRQARAEVMKKLDAESQRAAYELEKTVRPVIDDVFKSVANEEGYDFLLEQSAVLYSKDIKHDVTTKVAAGIDKALSQ